MILLFWIPLIGLIVGGIYLARKFSGDGEELGWFLGILGSFLAIIFLVICVFQPLWSGMRVAQYTTFYETNHHNYEAAIEDTSSYLSSEEFTGMLIAGSIEKFELAGYVSERVKEWRDEVNQFNLDIARYRIYSTHLLTGVLHPELPDHVQPLIITTTGDS